MKRTAAALEAALGALDAQRLRRTRLTIEKPAGGERRLTLADGRCLVDFSSNDYLGLASHPALAAALSACAALRGAGSGASHLVTGHGVEHARLIDADPGHTVMVVTDGVFSMDGDLAPLPQLSRAARTADAWLLLDDAHGLGVIGANGGGVLEHFGLGAEEVPILVGTLGKAFGSFGAFVAGSTHTIEWLIQKARSYIYTTALPQPVAAATRAALAVVRSESWRRERLGALTRRFRTRAAQAGVPLGESLTPIQPIILGSAAAALVAQRELEAAGFLVVAIRPPTVPAGSTRLRVTLCATHSERQIDELVEQLGSIAERTRRDGTRV